jgi:ABC-type Fe3+/spermidine/putrescine transport system ATPase subunit
MRGAELERAVEQALALVRLDGVARRHPRELSGGQRQRVALARAVVFGPGLLLLDEALGALDRRLREALQHEIRRIHRELGVTCVHITHDQEEALSMSDRVAVMREGRIEQVGRPRELYEEPASLFVARFVGDANVITGRYDAAAGPVVAGEGITSPLPELAWASSGAPVAVVVRPERVRLSEPDARQVGAGTVRQVAYLGPVRELVVEIDGGASLLVSQPGAGDSPVDVGSRVGVSWEADDVVAFAPE